MRRRIITVAIAATVLALVLFGVPLGVFFERDRWQDQRTDLAQEAAVAALAVAARLGEGLAPELPDPAPGTWLALYSAAGRLRAGDGPTVGDHAVRAAGDGQIEVDSTGTELVAAVPVMEGDTVLGVVRAATPDARTPASAVIAWTTMAALAVLAVGVAWLLSRRMAARLAQPLEELADGARSLGDGDFTVRAPTSGVPEIDQVGRSLESTSRRLGDILERERAFSATASHQLRTPLAGLRLQLEAALDSPDDPRPAIRTGIEAADRLEQTIDDLLALARHAPTAQVTGLDVLLADADSTWRETLAGQGRLLSITSHRAPRPRGAEAAIRQVLNVLVDNAVTHGQGAVRIVARDAGDVLAIDVSDEGDGVQPGLDVFLRPAARQATGRVPSGGGHGIGLALARSLAEAEGGRLVHAGGSTFTLLLPVSPAGQTPGPEAG